MKKKLLILMCVIVLLSVFIYSVEYNRWKHLWELVAPIESYTIAHQKDDTIKVVMIGDSWAGMHDGTIGDSVLEKELERSINCPVRFRSSGKGGATSREIYELIFDNGKNGNRQFFQNGVDYCIIFAGINDAAANLGTSQFCHNYRHIIEFLLENRIRPVVVEIPDVRIRSLYIGKPLKDLAVDYLRSIMTRCSIYNYSEYREALNDMLSGSGLIDSVLYVKMTEWNKVCPNISEGLFVEDGIHLNNYGYQQLDSCIVSALTKWHCKTRY